MVRIKHDGTVDGRGGSSKKNALKAREALAAYIAAGKAAAEEKESEEESEVSSESEVEEEVEEVEEVEEEVEDEKEADELQEEDDEESDSSESEEESEPEPEPEPEPEIVLPSPRKKRVKKSSKITAMKKEMEEMRKAMADMKAPKEEAPSYYQMQQRRVSIRQNALANAFMSQFS
jgi:hypothetical protein